MESNLSSWEKGGIFFKRGASLIAVKGVSLKTLLSVFYCSTFIPSSPSILLGGLHFLLEERYSGDIDGQLAHRSHNLRHTDSRTKTTYNANHFSPDSKLLKARWFTFTFALVQFPFPTPYVTTDAKNVRKMQVSWQETFAKDFFSVEWDWIDQRCEQWPKTLTNISLASAKLINYLKKVKICPNCQVIKVLVFVSSYSLVSSTLLYLLYDLNSKTFTRWSKGENWWILNKWSALRPNDKLPATFMT